ncbi:MAG: hypothetical protein JW931_02850, partial [Methanomicrobiaceae archaeon]|nr:hypothetical protein [Methanomicrobiaceae archaeon]
MTRTVLSDFVKWNIFIDNYSVNSFFTVLLPDNISKNEILKQNNVRTKYFYPDNYCGDYHHGSKKEYMLSIVYCYIYYDLGLFFGNKVVSFFRSNINFISEYLAVGVPSGQRVHEIREG